MNAFALVLLALLALAARTVVVRRRVAGWESLWRFTSGPITVELRRHAGMARFEGDSQAFPQPREFRVLSMRCGGIPIWSQQAVVTLPAAVDERIGEIAAGEFDPLFTGQFQLAWARHAARTMVSARH